MKSALSAYQFSFCFLLTRPLLLLLSFILRITYSAEASGHSIGINYGQIANNLPPPSRVAYLLQTLNISRVKLYDADPNVLQAFSNTNVEFIVGLGNEALKTMTNLASAQTWIQQHIQPFLPGTRITSILVGNEVFKSDPQLMTYLLPAMVTLYTALSKSGLNKQVTVTSAHSLDILSVSYPPSSGAFRQDIIQYMQPLVNFHSQINSPFLINAYPFFAYMANPNQISLDYALFQPNQGMIDPNTNLLYNNMLYAQIDAVYAAIKALGHVDVQVKVSETGWPSKGDADELGANPRNAGLYNGNLLRKVLSRQGTPGKPAVPVDVHVFALFNEDLKPGPTSERNYGLFYPDETPVYNLGVYSDDQYGLIYSSAPTIPAAGAILFVLCFFFFWIVFGNSGLCVDGCLVVCMTRPRSL